MPFEFKSFGRVVAVAFDVESLGKELKELSLLDPGCAEYHLKEGHISSWLRSIGEHSLAESLRPSLTASQAAEAVNSYLAHRGPPRERSPSHDATVCRNIRLTG
jgi:hypothetical protein